MRKLTARRVRKLRPVAREIRALRLRLVELPREVEISGEIPTNVEVAK